MIQTLTKDGILYWQCMGGWRDEHCLKPLSVHVSEAIYRLPPGCPGPRGAMIDLPACPDCGARLQLKADFTMRELFRETKTLMDHQGGIVGYALDMPYVRSLLVHHWLHRNELAAHAPVLTLPSQDEVSDPRLARFPAHTVMAFWFGYQLVQHYDSRLQNFSMIVREIDALPEQLLLPFIEQETHHGISSHLGGWDTFLALPQPQMQIQPE